MITGCFQLYYIIFIHKNYNHCIYALKFYHHRVRNETQYRTMFRHYILDLLSFSLTEKKLQMCTKRRNTMPPLPSHHYIKLLCSMLIHHIKLSCLWISYHNLLAVRNKWLSRISLADTFNPWEFISHFQEYDFFLSHFTSKFRELLLPFFMQHFLFLYNVRNNYK